MPDKEKKQDKIKILKTRYCDTRTLPETFSKADVLGDSIKHISAVMSVAQALAYTFVGRCAHHDWTKVSGKYLDEFYEALKEGKKTGDFTKTEWYQKHITLERHHPASHCCEDINLLDLLEMCADVTVAGMSRTGNIYRPTLSPEVLQLALDNTIDLIKSSIEVVDSPEEEDKVISQMLGVPVENDDIIDIKDNA